MESSIYKNLEQIDFEPEVEPISIKTPCDTSSPELNKLLKELKQTAETILHHWKTFPLILPPPISLQGGGEGTSRRKTFQMKDLFLMPSFEEKELASIDARGKTQRLSQDQLDTIRNDGVFNVESSNFSGQNHVWKLSPLLQKGKVRTAESFVNDIAFAARLIVVEARNRIDGNVFSLLSSVQSLRTGFRMIFDALFGIPSLHSPNLASKLSDERSRFLVAELICPPSEEDDLDSLCRFMVDQLGTTSQDRLSVAPQDRVPPVPYTFTTPSGLEIDLRLFCRNSVKQAMPLLISILEKESRGWFLQFREGVVAELKKQEMDESDIETEAQKLVMEEYLCRVYTAVRTSEDINAIYPGFGELLVEQAMCCVAMIRSLEVCQNTLDNGIKQKEKELEFMHPILSRIQPWKKCQLNRAKRHMLMKMMFKCHEDALQFCRENGLAQSAYFLARDLTFIKERAGVIASELNHAKSPSRTFEWKTLIWRRSQWTVKKIPYTGTASSVGIGQSLISTGTSQAIGSQAGYLLVKHRIRSTNTQWPIWRWTNFFHRTWMIFWNILFFLVIVVPWYSPVGFKALISTDPFYPYLEVSPSNGTLVKKRSQPVKPLSSRLLALLRHISKARTEFESAPDTGFIGKSLSRHLNCLWNYGCKGVVGSLCLLIGFPVICCLVCVTSFTLAVFSPLWVPVLVFLFHICIVMIYDFDSPEEKRLPWCIIGQALLIHLAIGGIVQPVLCLLLSVIILPALSLAVFLGSIVRYLIRLSWDRTMFHLLIKPKGRIPAMEGFLVKRIDGPGLKQDFKYRISREQAIAALEAKMEYDELNAFRKETEKLIKKPLLEFTSFVSTLCSPFGVPPIQFPLKEDTSLSQDGAAQMLDRETQSLLASLEDKVEKRIQPLQMDLSIETRSQIRLSGDDLKIVLVQASLMIQDFYPGHVLRRLGMTITDLWTLHGLLDGDWSGLAALYLSEVFSPDVLYPLNEQEPYYWLESRHTNLGRYTAMLEKLESNPQLPVLLSSLPLCSSFKIPSPYLDAAVFNPYSKGLLKFEGTSRKIELSAAQRLFTSKKDSVKQLQSLWDNLIIPLPIPHPAVIAVLIFNRDAEERVDAIPLDSELVKGILKSLEGVAAISVPVTPGVNTLGKSTSSQNRLLSESSVGDFSQSRQGSLDSVSSIPIAVSPESQDTIISEAASKNQLRKTEAAQVYQEERPKSNDHLNPLPSPVTPLDSGALKISTLFSNPADVVSCIFPLEGRSTPLFSDVRGTSTPINRENLPPTGLTRSSSQVPVLQSVMLQKKEQWLLGSQSGSSTFSANASRHSPLSRHSTPLNYPSPNVRHKIPKAPVPLSDFPNLSQCLLTVENPLQPTALGKSTSHDSIMFAEEGVSLVESPSNSQNLLEVSSYEKQGSNLTLVSSPVRLDTDSLRLASLEDLSSMAAEPEKRFDTPV
ncbi:uncharacterized protein LOC136039927 isoform X2 [Artemia franciscana]|uniref:Uncharacterized protein n=1 Tax=Artemia franciscana TaxID=6661 RepID=A0AA88L6I8_ARTSF|nr:hypothetical protein QYM36_008920 [Artemia franciscana]